MESFNWLRLPSPRPIFGFVPRLGAPAPSSADVRAHDGLTTAGRPRTRLANIRSSSCRAPRGPRSGRSLRESGASDGDRLVGVDVHNGVQGPADSQRACKSQRGLVEWPGEESFLGRLWHVDPQLTRRPSHSPDRYDWGWPISRQAPTGQRVEHLSR